MRLLKSKTNLLALILVILGALAYMNPPLARVGGVKNVVLARLLGKLCPMILYSRKLKPINPLRQLAIINRFYLVICMCIPPIQPMRLSGALPLNHGKGIYPLADACDYARYCSSMDFWSITDHAEASTPLRWETAQQSIRECQAQRMTNPTLTWCRFWVLNGHKLA